MAVKETVVSGVPQGQPRSDLVNPRFGYVLAHADDSLIVSQRIAELISWAPELETDIAIANIALDHLGVARALLTYAGKLEGKGRDENDLAFFRTEREFTNLLLVEQPNTDFAFVVARQLFFDAYQTEVWERLTGSTDTDLAGIAAKAVKETRYHLRYWSTWILRLGDGTDESHGRMQAAIDHLWRFTEEMFTPVTGYAVDEGIGPDPQSLRPGWLHRVESLLTDATLRLPDDPYQRMGGRDGFHTEELGPLLAEMQWMQRSFPDLEW